MPPQVTKNNAIYPSATVLIGAFKLAVPVIVIQLIPAQPGINRRLYLKHPE
jgi:hypothetical protein